MRKGLVSILTPCYNGESFIHRLLDSILAQTYPDVEMIVVDDGSTDRSYDIARGYIPRFEERGYSLRCVRQPNSGQSVAIDNGLKLIRGEFLVWPDSDDFYASGFAIEKMVRRLEEASPEFAMVRTMERLVDENDLGKELGVHGVYAQEEESARLFYDCLFCDNHFYFVPGAYMIRVEALIRTNGLSIYTEKNAGQNWQLLLPVLYSYRCLTIKEILYTVLVRQSSHSRGQYSGYERMLVRYDSYRKTILATLDRMLLLPDAERAALGKRIDIQYSRKMLFVDYRFMRADRIRERYARIASLDKSRIVCLDGLLRIFIRTPFFRVGWMNRLSGRFFQKFLARRY